MESGERLRRGCGVSGEKISCGAMRVRFIKAVDKKMETGSACCVAQSACDWLRLHRAVHNRWQRIVNCGSGMKPMEKLLQLRASFCCFICAMPAAD